MLKLNSWVACIFLLSLGSALAEDKNSDSETKVLSGISIVGNSEVPKSLTIVPWRSAQVGKETKLTPSPLNEKLGPMDRSTLMREMEFYKLGNSN